MCRLTVLTDGAAELVPPLASRAPLSVPDNHSHPLVSPASHAFDAVVSARTLPFLCDTRFSPAPVKRVIDAVLQERLTGKEYDEADAKEWSIEISEDVKARVKELAYKRYKIIVQVTIGELRDQGVRVASRCLWATPTDNYASSSFQNVSQMSDYSHTPLKCSFAPGQLCEPSKPSNLLSPAACLCSIAPHRNSNHCGALQWYSAYTRTDHAGALYSHTA